jgi:ferredoxin-NADP reductase
MPAPALPVPGRHRAVLRRVAALTDTTKHFEWEISGEGRFDFVAGQFLSLTHAHEGRELTRAYSLASPPDGAGRRFDLCLNRVPGGIVSNYLCGLEAGAEISFTGPHGFFIVESPLERDLVFLATGTGIAPIRGMLADLFSRGADAGRDVWLLFGVRYPETILYREEFERLAAAHANFHFVATLSRPPADWGGAAGYVQQQLRSRFAGRSDFTAYICGLKAMVDDARRILKEEFGLPRRQIRFEKYD